MCTKCINYNLQNEYEFKYVFRYCRRSYIIANIYVLNLRRCRPLLTYDLENFIFDAYKYEKY